MADSTITIGVELDQKGVEKDLKKVGDAAQGKAAKGLKKVGDAGDEGLGRVRRSAAEAADGIESLNSRLSKVAGALSVAGAVAGLHSLIDSANETQEAVSRMQAAWTRVSDTQGQAIGAANSSFRQLYALIGDTDTAAEASQDMANLAEAGGDLSTWMRIAAGATASFGDALPTNNLIESANETARTGTIVGSLADAFNWAATSSDAVSEALGDGTEAQETFNAAREEGKSVEDAFNAVLALSNDDMQRQQWIQDALNATLGEAGDQYLDANEALISYRESQAQLQIETGALGEALMPVQTAINDTASSFIELLIPYVQDFCDNVLPILIQGFQDLCTWVQDNLAPILENLSQNVFPVLSEVITNLWAFFSENVMPLVQTFVDEVLPVLVEWLSQVVSWIQQNSDILVIVAGAIGTVVAAWEVYKATSEAVRVAQLLLNAAMNANPIMLVISLIALIVGALITWFTTTDEGRETWNTLCTTVKDVAQKVKGAWDGVVSFFQSVPEKISGFFSDAPNILLNAGKSIIDGLLSGIKSAFEGVKSFVSGIGSWIAEHKGPIPYDLRLLVPNGEAIMESLRRGLRNGRDEVRDELSGITGDFRDWGVRVTGDLETSGLARDVSAAVEGAGARLSAVLGAARAGEREPVTVKAGDTVSIDGVTVNGYADILNATRDYLGALRTVGAL